MRTLSAVVVVLVVLAGDVVGAQDGNAASPSLLKATFGKLPIYFIENRGVYPDEVAYYIQGADKTLFFTREGITFRLKRRDRDWVVKLAFVGANKEVVPRGEDKQQAVFSYFRGPEKNWKTGLKTFSTIVYRDLWPGIDLIYRGTVNRLKYEFVVKPGTDPGKIRLRYLGVEALERTKSGSLAVNTPAGGFEDAPPEAWQEIDGRRVSVEMGYWLDADVPGDAGAGSPPAIEGAHFGFRVGDYDTAQPLILDPAILVYCGYIGGTNTEYGSGIAVDAQGNAYVTGSTDSTEQTFPASVGPDLTYNGGNFLGGDAFVAKVNAAGTGLVYCGYLGGSADDYGYGIAVDAAGNAYVTGYTESTEQTFPVSVGPDLTYNGGNFLGGDAFVAKVNAAGTGLVYCGYIGGSADDYGYGIAVDGAGSAYVTGSTTSTEQTFPVSVGPDLTHNDNGRYGDAFVAKVTAAGNGVVYCGYIGGNDRDYGYGIAVDGLGNAYVTGSTASNEQTFPVVVGPDLTFNGGLDAFVAKVNAAGTGLAYCGFLGGSGAEDFCGIAVDGSGNAYVTGSTASSEQTFPVLVGPDLTHNGGSLLGDDAFVAKVNATGNGLVYCGYLGGSADDYGHGIAVDGSGNAYVTGSTTSTEQTFPVSVGPDLTHNDNGRYGDAFVAKVTASGNGVVYCGYIGGSFGDRGCGISVDGAGNAYVTGYTGSAEQTFPVAVGPDLTHNLGMDAFVARISFSELVLAGTGRIGSTVTLSLRASDSPGIPYQVASSLGTGPIPLGNRQIDLSADDLLVITVGGWWPAVFSGYRGTIDSKGQAQAAIHIPSIPALIGVRLHSAFVTLDPAAPSGIRSISNTETFTITK